MTCSEADFELLLAYLRQELPEPQAAELTKRLSQEPNLMDALFLLACEEGCLAEWAQADRTVEVVDQEELSSNAGRESEETADSALVASGAHPRSPLLGFLDRLPTAIQPSLHPIRFFSVAVLLTSVFWIAVVTIVVPRGEPHADRQQAALPFGAQIVRWQDAVWAEETRQPRLGAILPRSQSFELRQGLVQLLFGDGAVVVLEGPARFQVDSAGAMTVERGKLLARVEGRAKGFTVHTPVVQVVDLGTEFGVEVLETETEVQVFTGSVQLQPRGSRNAEVRTLAAGQAAVLENSPQLGFRMKEKKMNRIVYLGLAAILSLPMNSSAQGALLWIDFGQTAEITPGAAWNNVHGTANPGAIAAGPHNLNYNTGLASGIVLGISSTGGTSVVGHSGAGAYYEGPYPAAVSSFPQTALRDGIYYIDGGTVTATLSNLNSAATYDFLFYGSAANTAASTTWTVTGQNNGSGTIANPLNNSTTVATVSGIIPDGGNQISILMSGASPGRWNVLQITENLLPPPAEAAIPEPASATILGVGGMLVLGLARARRRRAK